MNASLSQKIADAEAQVADMERKVKTVSIKKLKEANQEKKCQTFLIMHTSAWIKLKVLFHTLPIKRTMQQFKNLKNTWEQKMFILMIFR